MNKTFLKVLNTCIKLSREGEAEISVFDIMYETGFPYLALKDALDNLVAENELAEIDIKTYKFIGDINRKFDEPEPEPVPESLDDRIAILERRRQELLAKMERDGGDGQDDYNALFVTDARADGELMHCDDDELDRKFAEYERYLREEMPVDTSDDEDEEEKREKELVGFIIALFKDGHKKSAGEVPAHTEWDDEDDLLRFCAEQIITLISRDKSVGKQTVIKRAQDMLGSLRGMENVMVTELYERIIFELKNMSNYYFNKIRERC